MKLTHDKLYKKYEEPDVLGLRLITKWIIFFIKYSHNLTKSNVFIMMNNQKNENSKDINKKLIHIKFIIAELKASKSLLIFI